MLTTVSYWSSVLLYAPRRVGLPYGSYPRLLLAYLTTEAVRTKNPEIHLGAAQRLEEQLRRLLCMRLAWQTRVGLHPTSSGSGFLAAGRPCPRGLVSQLLSRRPAWRSKIVLGQDFFQEITRSAVPVDLRAIRRLQRSPLAIDLYVWLTYRMSYLRKPTVVPWKSLEAQFGADYSRPRDFRRRVSKLLEAVLRIYPSVRISLTDTGLRLYPSPPHVQARSPR